jgi:ABC-2 type transport system permease protein
MSSPPLALAAVFVRLRWRLLRGAIRHGGTEQLGVILSTVAAALVGIGGGAGLLIAGRTVDRPADMAIIVCTVITVLIVGFGIVSGISQPIDPRVIAAEPLSDRQRALGLLSSSALGPPGLAGIALGVGLAAGTVRSLGSAPVIVLATISWLLALLLVARTATNLLALLISRLPRLGQLVAGLSGLVFYGLFQFVPTLLRGLDDDQRARAARILSYSPPGQIGKAIGVADQSVGRSMVHLVLGTIWLPALLVGFLWSTRRLTLAVRNAGGLDTGDAQASWLGRIARRACGEGPSASIAWRSMLTRFRTPRTALETVTGAGVGLAAVLVPTILRDSPGSGAVLVGGAVQLAVLFMSGNSFGSDGPAITHELLAGADASTMARGKARSIAIVASPLALLGPLLAAVITDEWRYLFAGIGVGIGGLLAGTGAAVVQSALVPIAIPESDNPFAGGESGKGMVAALLLGVVLAGLAIATIPVALALFWASDRGRAGLVTLFAALTIIIGWGVMHLGIRIATKRLRGSDPEFIVSVTPAR